MDDFTIARIIHVVSVLFWIGGVGFITLVVLPSIRELHKSENRTSQFHRIERAFAPQARIWVLLAGASGFWMIWRADLWSRFGDLQFWWMHAMLLVWLFFAIMLFITEPFFLHRRLAASHTPAKDFAKMIILHRVLLALSVLALVGAVAGSHGLF